MPCRGLLEHFMQEKTFTPSQFEQYIVSQSKKDLTTYLRATVKAVNGKLKASKPFLVTQRDVISKPGHVPHAHDDRLNDAIHAEYKKEGNEFIIGIGLPMMSGDLGYKLEKGGAANVPSYAQAYGEVTSIKERPYLSFINELVDFESLFNKILYDHVTRKKSLLPDKLKIKIEGLKKSQQDTATKAPTHDKNGKKISKAKQKKIERTAFVTKLRQKHNK